MAEQVKRALCRWCHAQCRLAVYSENGRLTKIEEDRTDPRVDTIFPPTPPCSIACPASLDVLGYIALISNGKYREALNLIRNDVPLPGTIGRICIHPCETECERGFIDEPVSICALKRFAADHVEDEEPLIQIEAKKEKVAIIGSGPAGLSCAYYLAKKGYQVTIFEALSVVGGMLYVGIPDYRLPKKLLEKEINNIRRMGIEIKTNTPINNNLSLDDLFRKGYKAVFIGTGAHKVQKLGIPGEDSKGMVHGITFLRDLNLGNKIGVGKRIAVIGGGDVALDAARSALRLGSEVTILYRRSRKEMPAVREHIEATEAEGVKIEYLTAPVEILTKDKIVKGMRCIRMELGAADASGRRQPIPIQGYDFNMDVDMVIPAIGEIPDLSFLDKGSSIEITNQGNLKADPVTLATTREGVFAGGDVRLGPDTAIWAIADGKKAAISIDRYINGEDIKKGRALERDKPQHWGYYFTRNQEPKPQQKMPTLSLIERRVNFDEISLGFTEEMAIKEANRCLSCGCPRRAGAHEYIYHPERVRFPLKRVGGRGENKWERITWEQALDEIAEKLKEIKKEYGPESLFVTSGTGRTMMWPRVRFMNLFGTPNLVTQGTICFGPALIGAAAILGWSITHRTSLVIPPTSRSAFLIGINPFHSTLRLWKSLLDFKKRGGKIIVADPRRTRTTDLADIWLQHRPGTDAALLMAMINVIIKEGLYDREFVEKWCYGFDKLEERVREYSLEKASKITWVPPEKIREATILYAKEKPGISVNGMGEEHLETQQASIQARLIMSAIVGNIDVDGGDYMGGPGACITEEELELSEMLSTEQRRKQIGADRFKLLSWPGRELIGALQEKFWGKESVVRAYAHNPLVYRAMITGEPYPVRAGITTFSNPMVTQANVKLIYKALKSLDLYVVLDFWLTPSAQLADYVLPAACWLERPQAEPVMADNRTIAGERALPAVVPGKHEYWTDYDFFRGLGMRLDQEKYWPWKTDEEVADYRLEPIGVTLQELMDKKDGVDFPPKVFRKYEKKGGFATSTGKVELYSTILEKLGYDPLPYYEEPKESPISTPDLANEYPLILITGGRFQPYFHSEHRQIESIRKRRPEPIVQIHPEKARELDIQDGDWIWIETPRGRVKQKCMYFDGLLQQVVHMEHGWWFPELPGEDPWLRGVWESNVNVLTDDDPDHCDPRSGGWPLRTALCKIYKCKIY